MTAPDSYAPSTGLRPILVGAALFSLLAHLALAFWFHFVQLPHFAETPARLIPPSFTVNRVVIDDAQKAPEELAAPPKPAMRHEISLPAESNTLRREIEEIRAVPSASAPELTKPLTTEKPHVDTANLQQLAPQQPGAADRMDKDLAALSQQLLREATKNPNQSKLDLNELAQQADASAAANGQGAAGSGAGYSNLDQLLGAGRLTGPVKPLNLPGGALFDYDKFDLLPAAIATMQKLGQLIQKSPDSTFTVEGYTDSFGDAEHNLQLSQQRAEAVKNWLVMNMRIDPAKVTAVGHGSENLRVPASGTVEAQAPNRRVEIVIKTPAQ